MSTLYNIFYKTNWHRIMFNISLSTSILHFILFNSDTHSSTSYLFILVSPLRSNKKCKTIYFASCIFHSSLFYLTLYIIYNYLPCRTRFPSTPSLLSHLFSISPDDKINFLGITKWIQIWTHYSIILRNSP